MANDINKEDPHYKGEYGSIYEVNRKFPTGGVAGDFVVIEGWAHYWNADRGTWCVNAERDSYWDELITNIIEKFKLVRGATYMGVASLNTEPAKAIGAKMYYFATVAGTYKNFDNLVVPQGINVLYSENGSSWVNTTLLEVAQELGVNTNKVVSQKTLNDALYLKANQSSVNEALAKKADNKRVDDELAKKFDKESVVQESGEAEAKVMSQKAVSDKLSELAYATASDFLLPTTEINLINSIAITDKEENKYITLDGSLSENTLLDIYYYTNPNKHTIENKPKYVSVYLSNNSLTMDSYMIAIYNEKGELVKGYFKLASSITNIFMLPSEYTIKIMVYKKDTKAQLLVADSYIVKRIPSLVQTWGDSESKIISQKLSTYGMSSYLLPTTSGISDNIEDIKSSSLIETGYIALDGSIKSNSILKIYSYKNPNIHTTNNNPKYVRVNIGINNLTADQFAVAIYNSKNELVKGFLNIGTNIDNIFMLPAEFTIKVATFPRDTTCIIQAGDSVKKVEIPIRVQTWGDSITDADKYQDEIANVLGINRNNVKNFGISSDFSMHVANRFKSYFTEKETSNVFIGNAIKRPNSISEVPSYDDRMKELNNSFFVIWIGTNNLINYRKNKRSPEFTTQSSEFMKLCPQFNEKYDVLYSKSYISMIFDDIRTMVSLIPHSNFIIIGGHASYTEDDKSQQDMIKLNNLLLKAYPRNYVDIETLLIINSEIEYSLTKSFVKPEIDGTVLITLDSLKNLNSNSYLAIGTRDYYDLYKIVSLDSENIRVSAKLVSSNTGLNAGDTIYDSYNLVSDLGRDSVSIKTKVYNYNDILRYNYNENPWTIGMDVHFTNEGYKLIGKLIADEILKIYNKRLEL